MFQIRVFNCGTTCKENLIECKSNLTFKQVERERDGPIILRDNYRNGRNSLRTFLWWCCWTYFYAAVEVWMSKISKWIPTICFNTGYCRHLCLIFCLYSNFNCRKMYEQYRRWLDSIRRPLVSKVTTLSTLDWKHPMFWNRCHKQIMLKYATLNG